MEERIKYALQKTRILKWPRKLLTTFGASTVHYYVLTEPVYAEFEKQSRETVIREGEITWGKPKIFTPSYVLNREGFSDEAKRALEILIRENPELIGILYPLELKIEPERMNIVPGNWREVFKDLKEEIEKQGQSLTAVIKGINMLWDVSLMKFILEMTVKSASLSQLPDWKKRGFIKLDRKGLPVIVKDTSGIPVVVRKEIELMFKLVREGRLDLFNLKEELDRWGIFEEEEYEDRFFTLFKERRR
ncbi:MAG: hypothetical protein AB1610_07005 [Nitrospirota bacterium]